MITLSLATHTILHLVPSKSASSESESIDIFLPPRSLLILSEELYSNYLHSIEPKSLDTIEELRRCINWESWWESGAGGLEGSLIGTRQDGADGEEDTQLDTVEEVGEEEEKINDAKDETQEEEEEKPVDTLADQFKNLSSPIKALLTKRRFVEEGSGWERSRRISLTFRRVEKVRKAVLRF